MAELVAEQQIKVQELLGKPVELIPPLVEKGTQLEQNLGPQGIALHEVAMKLLEGSHNPSQNSTHQDFIKKINDLSKPETLESLKIALQQETLNQPNRIPSLELALTQTKIKQQELAQQHTTQQQQELQILQQQQLNERQLTL